MQTDKQWTEEQWQAFFQRRTLMDRQGRVLDDPGQTTIEGLDVPLNLGRSRSSRDAAQPTLFS